MDFLISYHHFSFFHNCKKLFRRPFNKQTWPKITTSNYFSEYYALKYNQIYLQEDTKWVFITEEIYSSYKIEKILAGSWISALFSWALMLVEERKIKHIWQDWQCHLLESLKKYRDYLLLWPDQLATVYPIYLHFLILSVNVDQTFYVTFMYIIIAYLNIWFDIIKKYFHGFRWKYM